MQYFVRNDLEVSLGLIGSYGSKNQNIYILFFNFWMNINTNMNSWIKKIIPILILKYWYKSKTWNMNININIS